MKRRLFIAINLPESIIRSIVALQKDLNALDLPVRWLRKGNLHITLKFLGGITDDQMVEVIGALEPVALRHEPVELKLGDIHAFPDWDRPRVIVVKTSEPEELMAFQKDLAGAVEALQLPIKPDNKPFKSHITIGRTRSAKAEWEKLQCHELSGSFEAESFDLMERVPQGQGVKYLPLKSYPLGG